MVQSIDRTTQNWPTLYLGEKLTLSHLPWLPQWLAFVEGRGKQREAEGRCEAEGWGRFCSLDTSREGVPWHLSVLCQTCKYPGCHRETRQKHAAKDHGAAVALLGTGSTLSPYAVTLAQLWLPVSLACTSLEDSLPVLTCPAV